MSFGRIAIIGVGLIGGSLGLAIKRSYPRVRVVGIDQDEATLTKALERRAIDEGERELAKGVAGADLIFLATPVDTIAQLLPQMQSVIAPEALITDVGSTKARICEIAQRFLPKNFIGGHPMTGSERQGIEAADPLLFENALYILTPLDTSRDTACSTLSAFVEGLGARVLFMKPQRHDRIVAYVSHLPQLLAVTLADVVARQNQKDALYAELAAGGFRDMTRIAASPYAIWCAIIRENAREIERAVDELLEQLSALKEHLGAPEELALRFARAAAFRNAIPRSSKGFLKSLHRVAVSAPDRPGVLAHMTACIAQAGITIKDIELLRVRENVGGTFHLSFESLQAAQSAAQALRAVGYQSSVLD